MMTAGQVGQVLLQMQPEPSVYKSKERPYLGRAGIFSYADLGVKNSGAHFLPPPHLYLLTCLSQSWL